MPRPLEGQTIVLAEGRQLEDLAEMLEKEGATPWRCPLISILDAPEPAPVLAWLDDLSANRFDLLVPDGQLLLEVGGAQDLALTSVLADRGFSEITAWSDEEGDLRGMSVTRRR